MSEHECSSTSGMLRSGVALEYLVEAMEFEHESAQTQIASAHERTATWTRNLIAAAKLIFVFSHGAFVISASIALAWGRDPAWSVVFLPVWLGDILCLILVVGSWFASCPYIKLCVDEGQNRLGDHNPSILTEVLPDIVMAFFGTIFLAVTLAAEVMLCGHLESEPRGMPRPLLPSAAAFITASLLAVCRGVCIQSSSPIFLSLGSGVLSTSLLALWTTGGLLGSSGWLLVLPWCASAAGLFAATVRGEQSEAAAVLCREERMLRWLQQLVLLAVLAALLLLAALLAPGGCDAVRWPHSGRCGAAAAAGVMAGGCSCAAALLWARLALVECRTGSVRARLFAWRAVETCGREAVVS